MSAPEYVPTPTNATKHYTSPPQRAGSWSAGRPGEVVDADPSVVSSLGAPGPDQGYALSLTTVFDNKVRLKSGEHRSDVDAGCVAVALKRASLFGRAPVVHDLRIAYTLFGYLDEDVPEELLEARKELFREVHYSFHYFERRAIADSVPDEVLLQTPDQVASTYVRDWQVQLHL